MTLQGYNVIVMFFFFQETKLYYFKYKKKNNSPKDVILPLGGAVGSTSIS